MANSVLANVSPKFPAGTVVGAYAAVVENRPVGAKLAEATVLADGSLTFEGLTRKTPGQTLYAAAKVSSVWQIEQFTGPSGGEVTSDEIRIVEERIEEVAISADLLGVTGYTAQTLSGGYKAAVVENTERESSEVPAFEGTGTTLWFGWI